jgi:hypothetical protein
MEATPHCLPYSFDDLFTMLQFFAWLQYYFTYYENVLVAITGLETGQLSGFLGIIKASSWYLTAEIEPGIVIHALHGTNTLTPIVGLIFSYCLKSAPRHRTLQISVIKRFIEQ